MLHPSYSELMETINKRAEEEGTPVLNSRYSIVIAAAKRARQLINEANEDEDAPLLTRKPLSIAVDELLSGEVKIVESDMDMDDDEEVITSPVYGIAAYDTEDEESSEYTDEDDYEDGYDDEDDDETESDDEDDEDMDTLEDDLDDDED